MLLVATFPIAIPVTDNVTMVVPITIWITLEATEAELEVAADLTAVKTVRYDVIDMPEASHTEAVA